MAKINNDKLNNIRDNYPKTHEWMQHKARWECMTMGAVLNHYEGYIDELMKKEDMENNELVRWFEWEELKQKEMFEL